MNESRIAFVIMQIGNVELDKLYQEIYIPAIKDANLNPKRIDFDDEGNLLKKEIVEYIENADIIIADLTNERPNCYLEIGYAMGLDKYKNIIFTAREDHLPESPNFKKGGPKIHFDVSGYNILFWDKSDLEEFADKLTEQINRRLSIIGNAPLKQERLLWEDSWLKEQQERAQQKLTELGFRRHLQIKISPTTPLLHLVQSNILNIADESQIEAFGWPIAVVFKNVPEFKPIPKNDGIISEVVGSINGTSYDFTYFRKNGQIFITKSLFEDPNFKDLIIPEARIKRTTELLLYLGRFYSRCNFPKMEPINIQIKYTGIFNNQLHLINGRFLRTPEACTENDSISEITTNCLEIETQLPVIVEKLVKDLFVLFGFFSPDFGFVKSIVDQFVSETNRSLR
jgi:hypothetical protein